MKKITAYFLLTTALVTVLLGPSSTARSASLVVNSLADTVSANGLCTLREAIQNANNDAATNADCAAGSGADTITFSASGTITVSPALGFGLPGITDRDGLTIDGAGQTITIDGNNLQHLITISGLVPLTVNNLTFGNSRSQYLPGAIENYGTLTITNSHFTGNQNDLGNEKGGAIYNQSGTVIIDHSTFSSNTAASQGGGIYSLSGTVTIANSTFTGNTAAEGGGIFCYGCTLTVTSSTFSGNMAPNGSGGGIHDYSGQVTITGSTFSGNGSSYGNGGGAIYEDHGSLSITTSIFTGNTATGSPGGAIYGEATITVRTSTFSNNSAGSGGGIYANGSTSNIANSTFTGNTAEGTGATGGGIYNLGSLIIANTTIAGNGAEGSGGGAANSGGTLRLRNTIVSNNTGGNCSGTVTNGGSNLDSGATCGWGSASGSMSGTNPLLGALTGSPAFYPLNPGSPAIDKGDDGICSAWPVSNQSQNGVTRPKGAHCDIGSYETGPIVPPTVLSIRRADANPTRAASVRYSVTFSEAVTGVDKGDFTLTTSGVTGAAVTGASGNWAVYTVTVNTGSGTGTIRLNLVDNDSIIDLELTPLGGMGAGNGSFYGGETYLARYQQLFIPLVRR